MDTRYGAGDGTRTRNNQLGRLMLYQLNYTRASRVSDSHTRPSMIASNR